MTLPNQRAVRIVAPASASASALPAVRKRFNSLVKKLEVERGKLALWREEMPKIRALAAGELLPLIATFDKHYRALLFL